MNSGSVTANACGKCILLGEHAVVYGAPAIAIPLADLHCQVTLLPQASLDGLKVIDRYGEEFPQTHPVVCLIQDAIEILEINSSTLMFHTRVQTDFPISAGLGSSAALGIAVLRAFAEVVDRSLSHEDLAALSLALERRFHGSPSGIDSHVIAYQKGLVYQKSKEGLEPQFSFLERKVSAEPWSFMLINSGEMGRTKAMVEKARPYFTSQSDGSKILQEIEHQVGIAVRAFEQDLCDDFIEAMYITGRHLIKAGLTTPKTREIIETTQTWGLKSAKITGAGGGGCILTMLPKDKPLKYYLMKAEQTFGKNNVYKLAFP